MIWLELRTNIREYDSGWNLFESVWAPTRNAGGGKAGGKKWPFWNLVDNVRDGDMIFHLVKTSKGRRFEGVSYASGDAYTTAQKPALDIVSSSGFFHRVELKDYQKFHKPILLSTFFETYESELRQFYSANKMRKRGKRKLFYVLQSGRLQCLNGAYFSEFDEKLIDYLLSENVEKTSVNLMNNVDTYEALNLIRSRVGHCQFSENVKRNYGYKCCFPDCDVQGRAYLISGHIARWSDNKLLRGNISNGLCLCLMHDKAFEKGYFTIDEKFQIVVVDENCHNDKWTREFLSIGAGKPIKARQQNPSNDALVEHWKRIGFEK